MNSNPQKGLRSRDTAVLPSRIKQFGRSTPRRLSPYAKHTLTFLFTFAHDDGTDIWCSVETLMDLTGFSRRTQFRALKELVDAEYLIDDGWKDYGPGLRTRRRRLDLALMQQHRREEDEGDHSANVGTPASNNRSANSGTTVEGTAVPDRGDRSARFGGTAVPLLAPKGTQEDSLEVPIDAHASAREAEGEDEPGAAFDRLFGAPVPAPVATPRSPPATPAAASSTPPPDQSTSPPPGATRRQWMPRLSDPEHRWAMLATGSEILPNSMVGGRKQTRGGYYIRDVAGLVAEAVGWNDLSRITDWGPLCAWLDEGIDPHDTILPVIRRMVQRRGNVEIATLSYFDRAVREAAPGGRRRAG